MSDIKKEKQTERYKVSNAEKAVKEQQSPVRASIKLSVCFHDTADDRELNKTTV